ncbi:MAG TPA: XisI protein, partial [Cyanobacteria bacterium UBA11149]|nr:XisI protein [Cyanobacteria bacterium UBA11367]HBE58704.1 XisI protein [Cyanobacteria bacterium UBA11366]HBK62299.1 XisI protein [Cyanobacteria bacterium UBA11166]HBR72283.1 XisI protein [Cyanobacteria bacterium UBA11159]HBS71841.1 XisI protein [Cyanobacteria bacterium UBA11153]HBW90333.1 XisI protein [Cyanobacteria bacterium UBA11149]
MDRLDYYRQCIENLLLESGEYPPVNGEIEVELVFDKERDRYLVIDLGWNQHRRVYNCFIHLDIKDGKIWIQRNQTDRSIAEELVQMGIAKEDIVLGVQPPYVREDTGYGVA